MLELTRIVSLLELARLALYLMSVLVDGGNPAPLVEHRSIMSHQHDDIPLSCSLA